MNEIDIREKPKIVEIINKELTAGNIIELKNESRGLVVVRITRDMRIREEKK